MELVGDRCGPQLFQLRCQCGKIIHGVAESLEGAERIAVARGGGVLGDFQNVPDLGEGELVPDFQNDDLPLFVRQALHRGGEQLLAFVDGGELRLEMFRLILRDERFPAGAALVPAEPIERSRADGGVEQRAIFDRMLPPPKTDERVLHDVLGIGARVRPAAREEEQRGAELCETGFPIFMRNNALHDLFTVF